MMLFRYEREKAEMVLEKAIELAKIDLDEQVKFLLYLSRSNNGV